MKQIKRENIFGHKQSLIFIVFSLFFIIFESDVCFVWAKDMDNDFLKKIKISQDRYTRGNILISEPNSADIKIASILRSNKISSLDEYSSWLRKNIKYTRDKGLDVWAYPLEFLSRGCGDCEDFAFLNKKVLNLLNYKADVLSIMNFRVNHAICVFKEGKSYSLFDNGKLIRTQAQDINGLALYLFDNYSGYAISKLTLATKTRDILFRKSEMLG